MTDQSDKLNMEEKHARMMAGQNLIISTPHALSLLEYVPKEHKRIVRTKLLLALCCCWEKSRRQIVARLEKAEAEVDRLKKQLERKRSAEMWQNLDDFMEAQHRRTVEAVLCHLYWVSPALCSRIRTMPRPRGEENDATQ